MSQLMCCIKPARSGVLYPFRNTKGIPPFHVEICVYVACLNIQREYSDALCFQKMNDITNRELSQSPICA